VSERERANNQEGAKNDPLPCYLHVGAGQRFGHVFVGGGPREEPHRQVEQQHGHRAQGQEQDQVGERGENLAVRAPVQVADLA